ncbi:hypothetical protein PHET_02757 [Paragonimus heterotremus]|uniref:Secreted protein n=1 Tax=Paragonimus heterotremus TaxID=100268 RepID=A0A8J4TJ97_9TREM|nr:hypothetical protein PHET_02757 [Paragonimus heterotremus]
MMMLQHFLVIILLGTFVRVSSAESHFGTDCNNGIRGLAQHCISEGYQQHGCSKTAGNSEAEACKNCPGCIEYAKSCLRYNLENTSPVNKCSNAQVMARTLKRQGY